MQDCIFCQIAQGHVPCKKVFENTDALAFMDAAKDVDGHILVIPKNHCRSILDCDEKTLSSLMEAVRTVCRHLVEHCGYDGVNLLNASGKSAGQSVPHFHIHIIPRKQGDGIDAWPVFPGATQEIDEVHRRIAMP